MPHPLARKIVATINPSSFRIPETSEVASQIGDTKQPQFNAPSEISLGQTASVDSV
jgi:hypothetical protein